MQIVTANLNGILYVIMKRETPIIRLVMRVVKQKFRMIRVINGLIAAVLTTKGKTFFHFCRHHQVPVIKL